MEYWIRLLKKKRFYLLIFMVLSFGGMFFFVTDSCDLIHRRVVIDQVQKLKEEYTKSCEISLDDCYYEVNLFFKGEKIDSLIARDVIRIINNTSCQNYLLNVFDRENNLIFVDVSVPGDLNSYNRFLRYEY